MCFSATASFVTAGVTAVIGLVSVGKVNEPRELPLAATPLLFALQQAIEGLLWLSIPLAPAGSASTGLVLSFLIFAEVFWPVFVPIAVYLIEPNQRRRHLMLLCVTAGAGVAAYLLWSILGQSIGAVIINGHIVYERPYPHPPIVVAAYLAATGLPPLLSSQRVVAILGIVILVGAVTAYVFYWEAFVSVWCFFAAVASIVILGHFEHSRRRRLRVAGA